MYLSAFGSQLSREPQLECASVLQAQHLFGYLTELGMRLGEPCSEGVWLDGQQLIFNRESG